MDGWMDRNVRFREKCKNLNNCSIVLATNEQHGVSASQLSGNTLSQ